MNNLNRRNVLTGSVLAGGVLLALVASACGATDIEGDSGAAGDSVCDRAAEHVQACFPGEAVELPTGECDAAAAQVLLDTGCDELSGGDFKADLWCSNPWFWWLCSQTGPTKETLARDLSDPRKLASVGTEIWWLDNDPAAPLGERSNYHGRIARLDASQSYPKASTVVGDLNQLRAFAVNASWLVWTASDAAAGTGPGQFRLFVQDRATGNVKSVLDCGCDALVLDGDELFIGDEKIRQYSLQTDTSVTLVEDAFVNVGYTRPSVRNLARTADGALYWTWGVGPQDLRRLQAGAADAESLASNVYELRSDGQRVVFLTAGSTVSEVTPSGTQALFTIDRGNNAIADLWITGNELFWLENPAGTVRRADLTTQSVDELAKNQDTPKSILSTDNHVYWINHGTYEKSAYPGQGDYRHDGSIVRVTR